MKLLIKDLDQDIQDYISDECSLESKNLKLIEKGSWKADGKYQHQSNIWQLEDKFYRHDLARSGSPFSDYHYEISEELIEVKSKEVIKTVWEEIK